METELNRRVTGLQEGFLVVNHVPTHVMTYGGWVDSVQENIPKILILVIPGNPGIIDYYQHFMETLYHSLNCQYLVWGVSHAGHVKVPKYENLDVPRLSGNEELYSLNGQIQHKQAFIEDYIPDDTKLILIGHSIGSYINLRLLNTFPKERILKAMLLFPTIEHLADSPQGKWAWPLVAYLRPFVLLLVYFLSHLSTEVQYMLLEWYFSHLKVPACAYTASMNIFNPDCTNKWMYMAKTELESLLELEEDLIRPCLSQLKCYYGTHDHWCPVSYYENAKSLFPDGDIQLCDKGYDHAFVLESGAQVGTMVAGWVQEAVKHEELEH